MKTLKFANLAKRGDLIRAYDFKPMSDRPDRYVEGFVLNMCDKSHGFDAYLIEVINDTAWPEQPRDLVFVPHEVAGLDYDGRIKLLDSPKKRRPND